MVCLGLPPVGSSLDNNSFRGGASMAIHDIKKPYLLLIGDMENPNNAKTAFGLRDWTPEACVGQMRFGGKSVDIGLPEMSPAQAVSAGAKTLVIGIAPSGGQLPAALPLTAQRRLGDVRTRRAVPKKASLAPSVVPPLPGSPAAQFLQTLRVPPVQGPLVHGVSRSAANRDSISAYGSSSHIRYFNTIRRVASRTLPCC